MDNKKKIIIGFVLILVVVIVFVFLFNNSDEVDDGYPTVMGPDNVEIEDVILEDDVIIIEDDDLIKEDDLPIETR